MRVSRTTPFRCSRPQLALRVPTPASAENLALAYAISGDWTNARTVAAQDLSADLVDGRIQQWMSLAKPAHAYDQVAALTGVTPAAADPGQPVRLALVKTDSNVAFAQAAPAPAPVEAAAPVQVAAADVPSFAAPVSQSDELAPAPEAQDTNATLANAAAISPEAPAAYAVMASNFAPKAKPAKIRKAAAPRSRPHLVRSATRRRSSNLAPSARKLASRLPGIS